MIRSFPLAVLLFAPAIAFAQSASTSGKMAGPAASAGAGGAPAHYASQSDAAAKCGSDTVVWANSTSKALHMSGDRYFGKSKHGFYACEKDAIAAGYHVAGHRKHAKSA